MFYNVLLLSLTLIISRHADDVIATSYNQEGQYNMSSTKNHDIPNKIYLEERIIGGYYAQSIIMFPYLIALNSAKNFCTGTIISPRHVLTAAHCFKTCLQCKKSRIDDAYCSTCELTSKTEYTLYAGSLSPSKATAIATIKEVHMHPEYKSYSDQHRCEFRNDIAVVELTRPLVLSNTVSTIPLASPSDFQTLRSQKCTLIGWGEARDAHAAPYGYEENLKYADSYITNFSNCAYVCNDVGLCSASKGVYSGACYGDSGGPLVCGGYQVGVISTVDPNCDGDSATARVDVNLSWIKSITSL